jgi:hypothetical protein
MDLVVRKVQVDLVDQVDLADQLPLVDLANLVAQKDLEVPKVLVDQGCLEV